MISVIRATEANTVHQKHGVTGKKLLSVNPAEVIHLEIEAGSALSSHKTPVDVFFYVLEGSGEIEIGDERIPVEHDMLVESPKLVPHALFNTGDQLFRVLVVKTPNPSTVSTSSTIS